ncbi:uncharacterized protein N0V89_000553 [Didymosphaeria variabile]|uniref:Ubiquitin 3 binding protein But2 C-terminal domain-containing protein n=1 Tax=Didymosphaeria variabile TaxID=1932322 RepID=A0A9W8XUI7_9PLEO|nr:uncharacterized protein N0V89_000553 [Didymosphaeria variabile]KAJ4359994.1 hypothetical protein N0V89_000553 [Didymosphaeria variabile]
MKKITILSLGMVAIDAVRAASAAQYEAVPAVVIHPLEAKWALHVNSVSGNPPMFKDRPIVGLTECTIDGVPQNHTPQSTIHLAPSFGLENFTIHPPSDPVIVYLSKFGDSEGSRYSLAGVYPDSTNWLDIYFVAEYVLPAPNDFIVMGWSTIFGDRDCPQGLRCDTLSWIIQQEGEKKILRPRAEAGAWDAVKTKEGRGWRVVWKVDKATVHQEVEILVVSVDR